MQQARHPPTARSASGKLWQLPLAPRDHGAHLPRHLGRHRHAVPGQHLELDCAGSGVGGWGGTGRGLEFKAAEGRFQQLRGLGGWKATPAGEAPAPPSPCPNDAVGRCSRCGGRKRAAAAALCSRAERRPRRRQVPDSHCQHAEALCVELLRHRLQLLALAGRRSGAGGGQVLRSGSGSLCMAHAELGCQGSIPACPVEHHRRRAASLSSSPWLLVWKRSNSWPTSSRA